MAAALAVLGTAAAAAEVLPVQYGGPVMGDAYGGPPDDGFGMGPGPAYAEPGGRPGAGRRRSRRSAGPFTTYHGFRIDLGEVQGVIDVSSAMGEVQHQIDIVDRSGLSASMLAKFRSVPIRVSASFVGGGGHYSGGPEVTLNALRAGDDRPVLLHEYMHVLEHRSFPGGFHNATVQHFFDEARALGLYPANSYMMSKPAEFFAVTASCYLNGTVARDPYTRDAIRERQPDYYAYLSRIFGPRGDTARAGTPEVLAAAR